MSSGVATDKDAISAQMAAIGVTAEHFGDIESINKYFDDNKINQLFNVSFQNFKRSANVCVNN